MKYAFIERHRRIWPICVQCRVLEVSVSGFHQHLARRRQIASRRHLSDAALLAHIRALCAEHRGAYGWPRIWRELVKRGIRVGKQRVQRLGVGWPEGANSDLARPELDSHPPYLVPFVASCH